MFSPKNKMRGQRKKSEVEAAQAGKSLAVAVIKVSEYQPRRIPSAKWRELIKKVWEADPLMCPKCQKEMRIVSLIDQSSVIERILRHLGLWDREYALSVHRPATACVSGSYQPFFLWGLRWPG